MNKQKEPALPENRVSLPNEEKSSPDPRIEQAVDMALMLARIISFRARYERETGRPFPRRGAHHG